MTFTTSQITSDDALDMFQELMIAYGAVIGALKGDMVKQSAEEDRMAFMTTKFKQLVEEHSEKKMDCCFLMLRDEGEVSPIFLGLSSETPNVIAMAHAFVNNDYEELPSVLH
jgi:hypothetical protein